MAECTYEEDKREYFRINFDISLCTEITISSVNGKRVKLGASTVCVSNIGIGGLAFASNLKFPTGDKIIYTFTTNILQKKVTFFGTIVRTTQKAEEINEYGVKFILDEKNKDENTKMFNTLLVKLRNGRKNEYYFACDKSKCPHESKSK